MTHAVRSLLRPHSGPDMGGLAHHPAIYDAVARRIGRGLYRRAVADLALLRLDRDALVLDLGTGPGRVPLMIATALEDVRVEGIDLSAEMIEQARARAVPTGVNPSRLTFRVADVADLPHTDGSVDAIVSTASMHHWQDIGAGIKAIARVLRPGGQAMIYDPWPSIRKAVPHAQAAGLTVRTDALHFGIARLTLFATTEAAENPVHIAPPLHLRCDVGGEVIALRSLGLEHHFDVRAVRQRDTTTTRGRAR